MPVTTALKVTSVKCWAHFNCKPFGLHKQIASLLRTRTLERIGIVKHKRLGSAARRLTTHLDIENIIAERGLSSVAVKLRHRVSAPQSSLVDSLVE